MQTAVIVLAGVVSLCVILIAILWRLLMNLAVECCEAEASELRLKSENQKLRKQIEQATGLIKEIDLGIEKKLAA